MSKIPCVAYMMETSWFYKLWVFLLHDCEMVSWYFVALLVLLWFCYWNYVL